MTSELVGKIKFCLDYLSKLLFFSIFENLTFFHFCNTNVRKFRKMFSSPEIFFFLNLFFFFFTFSSFKSLGLFSQMENKIKQQDRNTFRSELANGSPGKRITFACPSGLQCKDAK